MPEASAAVAAAQLLAFCKDPVRHRPRLTHGREIPPVGLHAFRFAQGKFPNGLLRELPAQERERLRKAANLFIRQICFWEGATHYQVLCVSPDARRETVKEHYHVLIALIHPDRQDADSEHWPAEAAHRVNLAYAVLSDAAKRAEYDARLHKSKADHAPVEIEHPVPETASVRVPVRGRFAAARMKFRKPVLFVTAAVASVFFLQAWLAADIPAEYGTLESATPLDVTFRAMRNVFSTSDRPRYLAEGGGHPAARAGAGGSAAREETENFLTPLFRMLSGGAPEKIPEWAPPVRTAPMPPSAPVPATTQAATRGRSDPGLQARASVAVPSPVQPSRGGREAPPAAQASLKQSAPDRDFGSLEMEVLVARLVSYYENGDLDRLLGMMDAESLSVWEAMRLRGDFRDFFQSTNKRRLHFQSVTWDAAGDAKRAKGRAIVTADFRDETPRLERAVTVEMEVRIREGQPRIAHLLLYPHE